MTQDLDPILPEIRAFLGATGMTKSAFGSAALKDPALVFQLEGGRELRRQTREKVRQFIATQSPGR
ncbi:hypothetical protein L2U69_11945 [Zavarzinia compransoris]|uniref:hypothetical protein n=1 Tax=Zavarzinia marina TaxID=2911065 RepID=UPI001F3EC5E1|nr:hypothetical protein [Zavarzinia marina]MCF4166358.1 hypothetical protein [Zavarzinia marina]